MTLIFCCILQHPFAISHVQDDAAGQLHDGTGFKSSNSSRNVLILVKNSDMLISVVYVSAFNSSWRENIWALELWPYLSIELAIESSNTAIIHSITTWSTLSHAFAAEFDDGLDKDSSTNPILFLPDKAMVNTLFQLSKPSVWEDYVYPLLGTITRM